MSDNVAIVTDTTADIPEDLARENNVRVIPLFVGYDGKIYKEGVRSYWTFVIFGDIIWIHMKKLYFQCKFQGGTKNGKKNEDHGW